MEDPLFAVNRIREILTSVESWNQQGKLAAFAATTRLLDDLDEHITELEELGDSSGVRDAGYASEHAAGLYGHIAAICGCGPDRGHDVDQHHVWAIADLGAIEHGITPA